MRRNRKRESLRFGTVARSIITCACVAVIGLAYVWQKNQIYKLGDELKRREATLAAAEKSRSGEGRGGEEGRSRGAPDHLKKKKKKRASRMSRSKRTETS